jgi:ABC-2 type transport system permease protein
MDKILLIFKREYLSRVAKKSFILTTLLTPLAILVFIVVVGFIFSYDQAEQTVIAVKDESGILKDADISTKNTEYVMSTESLEDLKEKHIQGEYNGILVLPEISDLKSTNYFVYYYSDDKLGLEMSSNISSMIRNKLKDYKIISLGINKEDLTYLNTKVEVDPEPVSSETEDSSAMSTLVGSVMGGVMGYIMFFVILIYGMMVMRSVMEEKINRIVEIMISSVRPFQLMMGKILGVGAVGFTQLAIWAILIPIILMIGTAFFGFNPAEMSGTGPASADMAKDLSANIPFDVVEVIHELKQQNWLLIVPLFIIYFLGGYIIYTSLFAAIGSAIGDDLNDGNSLTMPLMIPIVIAVYIMFRVVALPNSNLAIWSSIFPLFSPIIMPARFGADIPMWELGLSILLLILTALGSVWVAGRIYRVGILMYGKKVSFKELSKWLFSRG